MIVSAIVAMGKNREIGKDNSLLWRLSDDLKLFKKITLEHIIIMGRKTYESIGKPLPGRTTFVLSSTLSPGDLGEKVEIYNDLDTALSTARSRQEDEVIICGGEQIYKLSLPILDKLYLSEVDFTGSADAFFPDFDRSKWKIINTSEFKKTEKNQYDFSFFELQRC